MDIALALERIYPGADYRRADTYQNLLKTWKDKRQVPSEGQLAVAWVEVLEEMFEDGVANAAHEARVVILHDETALANMTCEQRVDLLINILRVTHSRI